MKIYHHSLDILAQLSTIEEKIQRLEKLIAQYNLKFNHEKPLSKLIADQLKNK